MRTCCAITKSNFGASLLFSRSSLFCALRQLAFALASCRVCSVALSNSHNPSFSHSLPLSPSLIGRHPAHLPTQPLPKAGKLTSRRLARSISLHKKPAALRNHKTPTHSCGQCDGHTGSAFIGTRRDGWGDLPTGGRSTTTIKPAGSLVAQRLTSVPLFSSPTRPFLPNQPHFGLIPQRRPILSTSLLALLYLFYQLCQRNFSKQPNQPKDHPVAQHHHDNHDRFATGLNCKTTLQVDLLDLEPTCSTIQGYHDHCPCCASSGHHARLQ